MGRSDHGKSLLSVLGILAFALLPNSFAASQTIKVTPSDTDLPIGTEVGVTAVATGMPEGYKMTWRAQCISPVVSTLSRQWRSDPCARKGPKQGWNGLGITDLSPVPGKFNYRAMAYLNDGLIANDTCFVEFHFPNECTSVHSDPFIVNPQVAFTGDPIRKPEFLPRPGESLVIAQTLQSTLKWNGKPLGPCAEVCFREKVRSQMVAGLSGELFEIAQRYDFSVDNLPRECTRTVIQPVGLTMSWDSPILQDLIWSTFTYNQIAFLTNEEVGGVIANRTHSYTFTGDYCDGLGQWLFCKITTFELVVEEAKDANGDKILVPNGKFLRIPIWRTKS